MKTEANPLDASQQTATAWFGQWIVRAEIAVLVISALFAAFVTRGDQSMDAISYFQLSQSILAHDWSALINGYWTPGYAFLLSIGRAIAHASVQSEWPSPASPTCFCLPSSSRAQITSSGRFPLRKPFSARNGGWKPSPLPNAIVDLHPRNGHRAIARRIRCNSHKP